jgi:hypothetical protein
MQKAMLTVAGALEAAIGLALLVSPSVPVSLLLGVACDTGGFVTVARIAGAALIALGCACWFARADGKSRAARGLIAAMAIYNVAAALLLTLARLDSGLSGVSLWPAVLLHAVMAAWCFALFRGEPIRQPAGGD